MKKIAVIDNYDSFVYNLVQYLERLTGSLPQVYRNDEITVEELEKFDKILISPGPGIPSEAGICLDAIKKLSPRKSILGICLGHQAVCEAFGGKLLNLSSVYHGIASPVKILVKDEPLLKNIPEIIMAGRYHSWVVSKKHLPECFTVTCEDDNGIIMGISHKKFDVKGLQFHPESILTPNGLEIIRNWIDN